jgi:PKD repeat protein
MKLFLILAVLLTVSCSQKLTSPVEPKNRPPQVEISAIPTSGTAPLHVKFFANGVDPDGDPVTYSWAIQINSGTILVVDEQNPEYTFEEPGQFLAKCTVKDSKGATARASITITVFEQQGNRPPFLIARAEPNPAVVGSMVNFFASAKDPDGDSVGYQWTIQLCKECLVILTNKQNPSYVFNKVGKFWAVCKAEDIKDGAYRGGVDIESILVVIEPTLQYTFSACDTLSAKQKSISWNLNNPAGTYDIEIEVTAEKENPEQKTKIEIISQNQVIKTLTLEDSDETDFEITLPPGAVVLVKSDTPNAYGHKRLVCIEVEKE